MTKLGHVRSAILTEWKGERMETSKTENKAVKGWHRQAAGQIYNLLDCYVEREAVAQIIANCETTEEKEVHGVSCKKEAHIGTGYLHGEDDDTPYEVDGCGYCGRCHRAL